MTFGRTRSDNTVDFSKLHLPLPVAIYLLTVVTPVSMQLGSLFLTLTRAYLLVMFLPLLFKLFSGKYGRMMVTDYLLMAHVVWMAVSLQINSPNQMIAQVGSIGADFFGGYLIARIYIRTPEQFMALARWLGIIISCLLPFVIYEAMTGIPLIIQTFKRLPLVQGYPNVNPEQRLGLHRAQGVMVNPIHFGLLCTTAFSMSVIALNGVLSNTRRILTGIAVGLAAFLSLSSGAFLALLMQIFFIIWYATFHKTGFPWRLLLGWSIFCYVVVDLLSNRGPIQVFFSYATFSPHTAYWRGLIFQWGMKNVWANPIFGIGLTEWVRPWFMFSGSMDNFWLLMGVRYGIPGFLFVAAGYGIALWRIGRRSFDGDNRMILLRRAWMYTFAGLTFTLCTVHVWTTMHSYVFFLFGSGMWLLSATSREDAEADAPQPPPSKFRYSRFPPRQKAAMPLPDLTSSHARVRHVPDIRRLTDPPRSDQ